MTERAFWMRSGRRGRLWRAGALLALVAAPATLGLLARVGPAVLDRFTAWWPPAGLGLLPLAVAVLVVLVTAFALATRGHRLRHTRAVAGGRFLPPLDVLLLQIGNLSFLAFALVLAVVTLGLLSSGLGLLAGHPRLVANDFTLSLGMAGVIALPVLAGRSWRASSDRWRWRAALLGLAVAGLWLFSWPLGPALPETCPASSQLESSTLASLYVLLWILLVASAVGTLHGRSGDRHGDLTTGRKPVALRFVTWVTYLGFLALYLNGALRTLRLLMVAS